MLKTALYADDVLLFLTNPHTSLLEYIKVINIFSSFLGYKINFGKSVDCLMGRLNEVMVSNRYFCPIWADAINKTYIAPVIPRIKNTLQT